MSYKLLVAEDQIEIITIYRIAFPKYGLKIAEVAMDGKEAVEKYKSHHREVDAVLMDHRMPILSGIEASREILDFDSDAVIIFASADTFVEQKALLMGVKSFKQKPFDLKQLVSNLDKHVQKREPPKTA